MRPVALALAVALSAAPLADGARAAPGLHPGVPAIRPGLRRRFFFRPYLRPPRTRPYRVPPLLPALPPGGFVRPLPPEPGPPLEGPALPPPFAHGFELTVPVGPGTTHDVPATLARYVEVGQALGACFVPPADLPFGSVTLRVSFRRDGSVFGEPRIPFSDAATPEQKTALAHSLLAALKRCTPLHLSPSLGGAIAGEIFAIRFVNRDKP